MRGGWVYILTNRKYGALYTGVTSDIAARMVQHREGKGSAFCEEHGITKLVYAEPYDSIEDAIVREKAVKKWRRDWKIAAIERANPEWDDLWFVINC
ncbi:GIY-YIG nuclease family protein [Novosphingobium sp. JCM 18896]|uniref:GIY-YIG nuclease family protein n=1 Tax=Novosphingobium sp. JCM 18896 TaxID=2989731 RepID=UPI00222217B6|nr:GIY-YIG nuclease family protein [Novosphingobium sp. JCM 18896]MCW1429304.1 GIY-YIG nuclease family protein [Novosphingobium sp. JCM 18896]